MSTADTTHMEMIKRRAAEYTRPADVESTVETHVIKEQDLFMLTDLDGNIPAGNGQGLGVYLRDTRFLSTYDLLVNGVRPTLLFSSAEKNCLLSVELTNPDLHQNGHTIRNQTINIHRSRLAHSAIYERLSFVNYGPDPVDLSASLSFAADYRDIFEVRGYRSRDGQGDPLPPAMDDQSVTLGYRGLDGIVRKTAIRFRTKPDYLDQERADFHLQIEPHEHVDLGVLIAPEEGGGPPALLTAMPRVVTYDSARHELEVSYSNWLQQNTFVQTSSDLFDEMFQRSVLDLRLLSTPTEWGPVAAAGVPWFSCVFGRDALITALQSLVFNPDLARATLRLLASVQGREVNQWKEEEPGKMVHELRRGEMAGLGEVPHAAYYGTVDATPLWLILLFETFRWTADRELVDELWAPALRALEWIDRYGDLDGDGYVEYQCGNQDGLINHGWKDSAVSVFNTDGSLAEQPIALVEVQAYVYAAKLGLASLCEVRGEPEQAARLRADAAGLRERFNRDFWMPDRNFLAFALDGRKQQVRSLTSNPGHALWAGIIDANLARHMLSRFKGADLLSGWGVRCVSDREAGYNPMGYHLGTVWPHDVSMLVAGLRRYGFTRDALTIATQLYHAGLQFRYYRFPEVFTGFDRTHNPFPVPYPVACSPQAWAAGTPLLLLQSMLGISPDAGNGRVTFAPALPDWLSEVRLSQLRVGDATLDLRFTRFDEYSTTQVISKTGQLEVMI